MQIKYKTIIGNYYRATELDMNVMKYLESKKFWKNKISTNFHGEKIVVSIVSIMEGPE